MIDTSVTHISKMQLATNHRVPQKTLHRGRVLGHQPGSSPLTPDDTIHDPATQTVIVKFLWSVETNEVAHAISQPEESLTDCGHRGRLAVGLLDPMRRLHRGTACRWQLVVLILGGRWCREQMPGQHPIPKSPPGAE